jgi:hypothetical protein
MLTRQEIVHQHDGPVLQIRARHDARGAGPH